MNRKVTIVMYHYVRDLEYSRFPAIKGLSLHRFQRQLEYIQAHFTPISIDHIFQALSDPGRELPPNAILLTFDDGYIDHFENVFPLLDAKGIAGCFFPPARAVLEHKVLDVNKIQFVLAATQNPCGVLDEVFSCIDDFRTDYKLLSREAYLSSIMNQHRYDSHEVTVIKRLLQRTLPEAVRHEIVHRLFEKHVSSDEAAFARELYMSEDQITCIHRHGMHVGSHGYNHIWLNEASQQEQTTEVDRSLDFMRNLGVVTRGWTMCYPYGGYNDSVLQVLRERSCGAAFTVEPRTADLDLDDPLTLPRIDTNDLPS